MEISPMEISPMEISPLAFSPMEISPMEISPEAYAGAQFRSLIGFSALEATANERIIVDTWDNADHFYVRVQGRNGAFSLAAPFQLDITMHSETCGEVSATHLPVSSLGAEERNYKTLILVDWTRMARTYLETRTLEMKLNQFASREEIAGRVINVKQDDRVAAANKLADENHRCPYAKNLVAAAIKEIVTRYREVNPLEYVVIVGDDDVIPYVRHPDKSTLGNEKEYVPPVLDNTTSQASLQLGYVLSQDFYGSKVDISLQENNFPVPELAVGRLVETPDDIMAVLEAYAQTDGGVVPIPTKALVTGYDFLEDAARAVQAELELGIALPVETLIADRNWSPEDPHSWTAGQLREQLLMPPDLDLAFLAGHFSANGALAADYRTSLTTSELANSTVDLTNAIIFSAGCHSGYNIVNSHGIPLVTKALDWPQAFAQKGATLIAGTGYQYGDTDFLEYSERLYLEFSRQLRVGTGPVSIGQALVAAKQTYLASLPAMRPIHEKSLLEATLFGLPMLSVNMPGERIDLTSEPSIVTGLTNFETDPGLTLGLAYTDVTLTPDLTEMTTQLEFPREALDEPSLMVTTTYFSGPNGVVTNPGEPVLPLAFYNISVPDAIIRGLGFRGGSYSDHTEVVPLIGAPTTEVRGIHRTFVGDSFYPIAPWRVNYFDRLTHPDGATRLMLTPAQYKSDPPGAETGILRSFDSMTLRLYYSDNTQTYGDNTPALSAPPSISTIAALAKGGVVTFTAQVVGNPAAGIQEVWVTYTAVDPGSPFANQWQSLDLTQDPVDGRVWQGTLNLEGTAAEAIRYMVQAVNGVGLVTRRDNLGAYFIPEIEPETPLPPPKPITIEIEAPPTMGAYNTTTTFNITVRSEDVPLTQTPVILNLGAQRYAVVTNEEGQASVTMPLLEATGVHEVQITVPGSSEYQAAVTTTPFEITRQSTSLSLEREVVAGQFSDETNFVATLAAGEQPLAERTVFFVATSQDVAGTTVMTIPVITDYAGRAYLGQALLPASTYTVQAVFSQAPPEPDEPPPPPDDRYDSSTISGELLISPEEAQVIYTGETVVGADGILHLSATVTQNDDGSLGNLAVAQVQYDVQHTNGTVMITTQAPVDENGHSATTLSGLPAGTYQVAVTVVGGFFSSPASSITFVNEADSRNQNGNFKFDSDELGDFTLKGGADPAASRITFDDLTAGSYSVTERGSRGRSLADVSCHLVGQEVRADYTLLYAKQGTLNGVTVHLSPSQHVICTFINVNPSGKQNVPTPSTSQIYLPLIFK